jgi:hypothetical protein
VSAGPSEPSAFATASPPDIALPADPAIHPIPGIRAKYSHLVGKRARVHIFVSIWLVAWCVFHMCFQRAIFSNDLLWLQYYSVNYEFGFVRRGLGGELIRIFPASQFLTASFAMLWASIIVWLIAVAVLMWRVVSSGARSERRMMLALAVPVLPFAFSYATCSPHPELFAMTALLAFGVLLTRIHTARSQLILSAAYGVLIAVLAFVHEAIPLEFALGAILAIFVLPKDATLRTQQTCTVLAVAPGILSILLIAGLGHQDIASQLCAQIPHETVENPWAVSTTPQRALDYMLGHIDSRVDYHDWVCQQVIPTFNCSLIDDLPAVAQWGFLPLFGAFILGLLYFVGTICVIRYLSGVPVRAFVGELRGNLLLPLVGAVLVIPLFVAGVDWTRWWVLIAFDVAVVYILCAIARPEIEQAPSRTNVLVFACVVVVLAVIPTGTFNNVGTY